MHFFLIEITYDAASADALRTLVLEAEDQLPAFLTGKGADGIRFEGSWVALESCAVYLILDAKDGLPIFNICREVSRCAPGIRVRVIPVLPISRISKSLRGA
jgi:hypothetical protein